jgi:hypothetical protein
LGLALAREHERRRDHAGVALPEIDRAAACGAAPGGGAPCVAPANAMWLGLGSELEASADVHHRCAPCVDRADDLLDIDPLQVNARRGHIRMPQLTLDDR